MIDVEAIASRSGLIFDLRSLIFDLEISRVVLLQLLSVVGCLRSDEGVVVSDDLLSGQLAVLKENTSFSKSQFATIEYPEVTVPCYRQRSPRGASTRRQRGRIRRA